MTMNDLRQALAEAGLGHLGGSDTELAAGMTAAALGPRLDTTDDVDEQLALMLSDPADVAQAVAESDQLRAESGQPRNRPAAANLASVLSQFGMGLASGAPSAAPADLDEIGRDLLAVEARLPTIETSAPMGRVDKIAMTLAKNHY
jgi:hypothetical protein